MSLAAVRPGLEGDADKVLKIPLATFANDKGQARPELPDFLAEVFEKALVEHCADFVGTHQYKIYVQEGLVGYRASHPKETEFVNVSFKVRLKSTKDVVVKEWFGTRNGEKSSMDASVKSALSMLNLAYKTVFVDALYGIGSVPQK